MTIQIRYNVIKGVVKMHYQVRPARMADLERIEAIYAYARKFDVQDTCIAASV